MILPILPDTYETILADPTITDIQLGIHHLYNLPKLVDFIIRAKYITHFKLHHVINTSNNRILYNTILDAVAQNTSILYIDINVNHDSYQSVCILMNQNITIKEFNIIHFSTYLGVKILEENKNRIIVLNIIIDTSNYKGMLNFLTNNNTLKELYIKGCYSVGFSELISHIENIQKLILCKMPKKAALINLFKNCPDLSYLHFTTKEYPIERYIDLIDILKYNETVTSLHISGNEYVTKELIEMFQTNYTLTRTDTDLHEIQAYLDRNKQLADNRRFKTTKILYSSSIYKQISDEY